MPLLARKIAYPALWAAAETGWATAADFPYELLHEFHEARSKGMSCFEIANKSKSHLAEIAAALFMGQQNQSSLGGAAQFRFIHTDDLTDLGISHRKTPGGTKNAELNKNHHEIVGCD